MDTIKMQILRYKDVNIKIFTSISFRKIKTSDNTNVDRCKQEFETL